MRAAWPSQKPMSVRISATDWAEGGITGDDAVLIASAFAEAGVDLVDISTGQTTRDAQPIYDAGVALLRKTLVAGRGVRLVGLTAINLSDAQQLTLFDAPDRSDRLARSIDVVRERFGDTAITRARLLTDRPRRRFDFGERPEAPKSDEADA